MMRSVWRNRFGITSMITWDIYLGNFGQLVSSMIIKLELYSQLIHSAGFDSYTSSQDIGYVFEVEREVGSFYRGWDDDMLEDDPTPLDGDREMKEPTQHPTDTPPTSASLDRPMMSANLMTASPSRMESIPDSPRSRSNSLPSRGPSPDRPSFPPGPRARPRRNSSIHEPSPLARLFVKSPDRTRRQSIIHAILPSSSSNPVLSSVLSPRRRKHSRVTSQPISSLRESTTRKGEDEGDEERTWSGAARGHTKGLSSLPEMPEGSRQGTMRGVRFPTDRVGTPAGSMTIVHRPASPLSDTSSMVEDAIGKASEVADALRTAGPGVVGGIDPDMKQRLEGIEDRQKRIEELLQMLVDQRGLEHGGKG